MISKARKLGFSVALISCALVGASKAEATPPLRLRATADHLRVSGERIANAERAASTQTGAVGESARYHAATATRLLRGETRELVETVLHHLRPSRHHLLATSADAHTAARLLAHERWTSLREVTGPIRDRLQPGSLGRDRTAAIELDDRDTALAIDATLAEHELWNQMGENGGTLDYGQPEIRALMSTMVGEGQVAASGQDLGEFIAHHILHVHAKGGDAPAAFAPIITWAHDQAEGRHHHDGSALRLALDAVQSAARRSALHEDGAARSGARRSPLWRVVSAAIQAERNAGEHPMRRESRPSH